MGLQWCRLRRLDLLLQRSLSHEELEGLHGIDTWMLLCNESGQLLHKCGTLVCRLLRRRSRRRRDMLLLHNSLLRRSAEALLRNKLLLLRSNSRRGELLRRELLLL